MRNVLGAVLIYGGVALGLYVGLWWGLIGGVLQIADSVTADPMALLGIVYGLGRVLFAALLGTIVMTFFVLSGAATLK